MPITPERQAIIDANKKKTAQAGQAVLNTRADSGILGTTPNATIANNVANRSAEWIGDFKQPTQPSGTQLGGATVVGPTGGAVTTVPQGNTGAQPGSVSYLLGDGTTSTDQQFINDYIAKQTALYNTPIDEAAIRSQKEAEMQAQIDAINKVYADKLIQSKTAGQGRIGTNIAQQARGGLLGSDFGTAQQNQIQDVNKQANDLVEQERLSLVNQLLSDARTNAATEISNKRAAIEAGGKALLDYYSQAPERKAAKTKNAAQKILALGKNPQDVSDEELKQLGISRQDLTLEFTAAKQAQEAAQATAQLEQAKKIAEIEKLNADIAKGQLDASKYYEVGNRIYEQGTNRYIGDSAFNPYSGAMQVTPGNQVYNPVTGQFTQAPGGSFSTNAPAGGFRTDRHNNPTAMTTDVARSLGLVEGVDYTRGDAFPNNPNLFTARLNGDPIQTTIKALDNAAKDPNKNAFRTQGGQPRWTYIDMTDEQWNAMSPEQKTATITKMYQNEGGTGTLVGGGGGGQSVVEISMQPAFKNLRAKEQTQAVSLDNLVRELNKYREIIQNANIGKGGVELVGVNAGLIESQLNALLFAAAQAEGTGALQAADRQVLEKVIPNPTTLTGAFTSLKSGGLEGVYAKIDNQIRKYEENLKSLGLSASYVRPNTTPPTTPTTGNAWTSPTGKTYNF